MLPAAEYLYASLASHTCTFGNNRQQLDKLENNGEVNY